MYKFHAFVNEICFLKIGGILFEDEIVALNREVEILKAKGINIIIALGHSGIDRDQEIAKAVPDLDVVVGGHSHTLLYSGSIFTMLSSIIKGLINCSSGFWTRIHLSRGGGVHTSSNFKLFCLVLDKQIDRQMVESVAHLPPVTNFCIITWPWAFTKALRLQTCYTMHCLIYGVTLS